MNEITKPRFKKIITVKELVGWSVVIFTILAPLAVLLGWALRYII